MKLFPSILLSIALSASISASAQSSWRTFSPPDKSFIVELPKKPQAHNKREDSSETALEDSPASIFDNIKNAYIYTLSLRESDPVPDFSFGVAYFTRPVSNRQFDQSVNSNMLWIGGDDKHFLKEENVVVSGFHSREFIYEKGIASGRALFVNAGSRMYYLMFHTEVVGDISSEAVSRIFRTFKPLRRAVSRKNI